MSAAGFRVARHFDSPADAYDELAKIGAGSTPAESERRLFRGESDFWDSTTPGTYRALTGKDPLGLKFARIDATGIFVEAYEDQGGDPAVAESLAQHYLTTSDGLDFSASLGVALAFALGETEAPAPRRAYLCVLDRDVAERSDRFHLLDLRSMREALRPIRQHGFVAVHRAGHLFDLKRPESCSELSLTWYSFTVRPGDVLASRHREAPTLSSLYDIRDDVWAHRMATHLESLLDEPATQWGPDGVDHLRQALEELRRRTGDPLADAR